MLKIAILGTRGIPNNYGGFEQCAERLSLSFAKKGYNVTVYNPDYHPYKKDTWHGVNIQHIFSKENIWGNFIYDYICLKDALKKKNNIVLELGYVPNSLFYDLIKRKETKLITNMDGIEWRRKKWNFPLRKFAKYCEKTAIGKSDAIVTDNPGIKEHFLKNYNKNTFYIPYGAELCENPEEKNLKKFGLEKYGYYMSIARLEPENNIREILNGYTLSQAKEPFVLIGDYTTKYGKTLKNTYKSYHNIRFVGNIYSHEVLNSLRWYSKLYFHGHSIGGTNPSLLEAMASNAYIVAHSNEFNQYVLGDYGLYFSSSEDVARIINDYKEELREKFIKQNREKIKKVYSWDKIADEYLSLFVRLLDKRTQKI